MLRKKERVVTIAIVGIDLGKNSCSVAALDGSGAVLVRRRMSRAKLAEYVGRLPACVVAMEACCGAHHLGRVFEAQGHAVRLMSPEYVQPYVKARDRTMTAMRRRSPKRPPGRPCGSSR